ncbi:hypothetical protein ANTHELSMS3_03363 [Antarctobacter heliothermus]|uniref:Uncharacterized protein n=1 Tax=Antarctobacter heliothermus TaxID=74033 RepID=A0A222E726_9RHOB|nr:hypothetical protein [Antarctobacter heliothermus]ASP21996.1 hypothetical protein ANTHELSMS3_03363 [Antarctobacter heliothermus]
MVEFIFLTLGGWALVKAIDFLWLWLRKAIGSFPRMIPFVLVRKEKIADLNQKARCLELLSAAYDQLPVDMQKGQVPTMEEEKPWRH